MTSLEFKDMAAARAWVRQTGARLKRPCIVLLSGDLGAGKTQFVRWFLEDLGVRDTASPTFGIHHQYVTAQGQSVEHVDLYRVQNDSDLEASGFWDLLTGADTLAFVEWADRLPEDVWPRDFQLLALHLGVTGPESRHLEVREIKRP